MYKHWLLGLGLIISSLLAAQEQNGYRETPEKKDSLKLKDYFLKARWEFHTRTFAMSTINDGALKDDYAIGSGAGIGLVTHPLYGFQVGASGFFMYNLTSSDIHNADPSTQQPNRYEAGLFDLQNPGNKNELNRLEALYLKYSLSKSSIAIGKMNINTPFLNPQDGRMRPTIEEGVWLNLKEFKKVNFSGGWLWNVSPRSTLGWFTTANSIGIYPVGVNSDGTKSGYANQVQSSGIAIANVQISPSKTVKINIWDGFLDNVMNTAILEINTQQDLKACSFSLYQGIQYFHQDALNNGGNSDPAKTYINKGNQSNVISLQAGLKTKKVNTSLNYTHITGDGRYLMPREWGREFFYTFLPRERNEGFGNVHAFMTKTSFTLFKGKFRTSIGYGYYQLPDVKDYRLNKYGMPSYHQINYDASYSFEKFLKGLELRFLAACKLKQGQTYDNLKYEYNKVNMINFNLVIDFKI